MYSQMPQPTAVMPTVIGSQLAFNFSYQAREVPASQLEFLTNCGWTSAGNHPDTFESLFRKPAPPDSSAEVQKNWPYQLGSGYWHWYEAVAYEFSKFITIGDDSA